MYAEQFRQPTYMLLILPQNPVYHGGASPGRAPPPPGLELTVVAGLQEGRCILRPSSQVGHRRPCSIPLAKACKMVNPDSRVGKLSLPLHGRSWESHLAKGEDTRRLFGTLFFAILEDNCCLPQRSCQEPSFFKPLRFL